jgi:glycine dehydrogenase subunit 1
MPYIPNTDQNRKEMLKYIGVSKFEDLLKEIPEEVKIKGELQLPEPLSEFEVTRLLQEISNKNEHTANNICFLGGGAYDHFIPAAIDQILLRSEFYTAYTPYQPEVSQGNLQAIYEYQTMITELTGMDVSNASMYDGASALAEAALLIHTQTNKSEILVSKAVHPFYRQVVKTYCHRSGIIIKEIDIVDGITDLEHFQELTGDNTAGILIQHPNFLGNLEQVEQIEKIIHNVDGLYVVSVDPVSLGILKPPGKYGADVVTGEGQSFGNPLYFGGPYVGIFAVKNQFIRRLPGRLAGMTQDRNGQRGFVLTLQTREQHIRREKATSSICTNEQLCALASSVYLALMGKQGLPTVANLCLQKAYYLASELKKIRGIRLLFPKPFFKEFSIQCPINPNKVIDAMLNENIFAGIILDQFDYEINNGLLIAVTEKRTKDEMDQYVKLMKKIV